MLNRYLSCTFCVLLVLVVSSCTRRISPNTYSAASVGEASQTFRGVVIGLRQIEVKEAERLQDNSMGMGVGALAGGALGSQIGSGTSANVVGAVVGALAGGTAGTFLQDSMGTQDGIEYTVQLDNGRAMTVVQGPESPVSVGQRVLVIISQAGRSRVVADSSAHPAPVQHYAAPVHYQQPAAPQPQHQQQVAPQQYHYQQPAPQQQHQQQPQYAQQPVYDIPPTYIVYNK